MKRHTKEYAQNIIEKLKTMYPTAHCELNYSNPFELVVATVLSAQCTDVRVNMVTEKLFKKYTSPEAFATVNILELEQDVKSTGFYRNKAKNIQGLSRIILMEHNGEVPDDMENLVNLPGVGRKTANVVLWNAFGKNEGVVVDTHVKRISKRLGITKHDNVEKIEKDLIKKIPQDDWGITSHLMIFHGRRVCNARKPQCKNCELNDICPSKLI